MAVTSELLLEEVRTLQTSVAEVREIQAATKPLLKKLDAEVFGNGQPGLAKSFSRVQSDVAVLKTKVGAIVWLIGVQTTAVLGYLATKLAGAV